MHNLKEIPSILLAAHIAINEEKTSTYQRIYLKTAARFVFDPSPWAFVFHDIAYN